MSSDPQHPYIRAGLFKRFAAMLYDSFLIVALIWVASIPVVIIKGDAITSSLLYQLYLLSIWYIFYVWFWTHGGQTLGMKAWKIYAYNPDGSALSLKQASIRFFTAAFGIANLSLFFDRKKLAWHERLSNSITIKK